MLCTLILYRIVYRRLVFGAPVSEPARFEGRHLAALLQSALLAAVVFGFVNGVAVLTWRSWAGTEPEM